MRIQSKAKAFKTKHPLYTHYNGAKYRAKQRGLEFTLSLFDLVIPDVCPVFGTPFQKNGHDDMANAPSLDRHDNNKGYTKENVRVISNKANTCKNSMTVEQCEKLLAYMKS